MASSSHHKRAKMGMLPGDIPKQDKARMLEGKVPFFLFPWQPISKACGKSFKKDYIRRTKSKVKRRMNKEMYQDLEET